MTARYVYAIIPVGDRAIFDGVAGMDEDRDEVYSLPHDGLAAVVGASPLAHYRGLRRDQAVRYLVAHQRVVEAVMRTSPVLPLKFGTVLPDERGVRQLLRQGAARFRAALDKFAGLAQMEVAVLWDLEEVFEEIGQEGRIAQLRAQVAGRPAQGTMAERVAIGQMVHAALERRRDALCDRLIPPLREVAQDLVANPLMDDSMVANVALLVDRGGREALGQRLEMLDARFGGRLLLRCVGPLPPYSFATVEVRIPSFEAVEGARRRLRLGERATAGEIKGAYRRLASQLHPDRNPQDPEAESRMAELADAHELLTAYAEGQMRGAGGPAARDGGPPMCDFSRGAVGRTLLIALRRQEG